ncbi:MAG: sulfate transporter [Prevotella sp.]|nr:sulfate transporter [Prevotella sp.]
MDFKNLLYSDFLYYLFGIIVLVTVFFLMKKITSCLIKTVVMIVILAILSVIYYIYFMQ